MGVGEKNSCRKIGMKISNSENGWKKWASVKKFIMEKLVLKIPSWINGEKKLQRENRGENFFVAKHEKKKGKWKKL